MARIRTLKPEFWADEKLGPLAPIDRLVFLGLVSLADDAGRLVDSVRQLDGLLFPYTNDTCSEALDTLARLSRVRRYTSESGQRLIQVVGWAQHQRVDKPAKYVLPAESPESLAAVVVQESSRHSRETLATSSRSDLVPTTPDLRPKKQPPSSVAKKAKSWKFCPPDFQPTDAHRLLARQLTVNFDFELAKFMTHEFDKAKTDPGRAFANWIRTASEHKRNGNGSATGRPDAADQRMHTPEQQRAWAKARNGA